MTRLHVSILCSVSLVALLGIGAPVFAQSARPMETYQRLKREWDEKRENGATRAELKQTVEQFWAVREAYPDTKAAAEATVEAFRVLDGNGPVYVTRENSSVPLMRVKLEQVDLNEPIKAQLMGYVSTSYDEPVQEWRRIAQQSKVRSVQAAALFHIARRHHRYSRYEKAENLLDSLSVQYGMTQDHPRFGSEIEAMRRDGKQFAVGRVLPALQAETLSGDSIDTQELRGTVVLLYFYGSTCGACIPKYPMLNELGAKYDSDTFRLIGIPADASGLLTEAEFRDFMEKYGIDWLQAWDDGLFEKYNVFGMPTAMLLDRTGRLVWLGRTEMINATSEFERLTLSKAITHLVEEQGLGYKN